MKGFMKDGKFHPMTDNKGVRKARDQSKFVGIKIARDERARQQLKGAPESIKICSTCDRSFDISKQKGNDFFALPQCSNCKRKGVPPLGERKARGIKITDHDLEVGKGFSISPRVFLRVLPRKDGGYILEKVKMPTMNRGSQHTTLERFDSKKDARMGLAKRLN